MKTTDLKLRHLALAAVAVCALSQAPTAVAQVSNPVPVAQENLPAEPLPAPDMKSVPAAIGTPLVETTATPAMENIDAPSLAPVTEKKTPARKKETKKKSAKKTDSVKAEPAEIRPLPDKYLVVKKERNATEYDARLTAARSALGRGDNMGALEVFNELYLKGARDARVLMGRAVAMQRLKQDVQAITAYREALTIDPRNLEALTNMLGLLKGQDKGEAIAGLQQLREIYPFNPDVAAQLGMAYGAAGEYEQAIKYLETADALKPGSLDVLYNRAVAYDHLKQTDKAADLYRRVINRAESEGMDQNFPLQDVKKRLATLR